MIAGNGPASARPDSTKTLSGKPGAFTYFKGDSILPPKTSEPNQRWIDFLRSTGAVASQFVGDQLPGRAALPLQQLAEESFGGFLITVRLDEDINHITILVYRAPEVLAFALYLYEDLVQVPCVTKTTLPTLQSPSVFRPELNAPKSDRFVRNRDASLSEQLFDVSKAHAKSVVEPDGVADDFRWKSIAVVAWRIGSSLDHSVSHQLNLTAMAPPAWAEVIGE